MICPYCNTSNPRGELFCTNCGYNLQLKPKIKKRTEDLVEKKAREELKKEEPLPLANLLLPDKSTLPITENLRVIGRQDISKSVPFDISKYVSREHLSIMFENDKFYIEDGVNGKPSLNGTKLNDVEIKEKGRKTLSNGDEILMAGAVKLIFQIICKDCGDAIPLDEKKCPRCAKPKPKPKPKKERKKKKKKK
jgi:uncharacterized Zn finger protein (UPF0148 family)